VTDGRTAAPAREADPSTPVRTVFLGSGRFAQPILARLAGHPAVNLVGVVTAPPRSVGRRKVETPTPIDALARELGVPVLTPDRLRDTASLEAVLDLGPDLIVLADYGQIVPAPLLDRRHGALNLHPSLLPRHRGATPIPAAILAGDPETGVTLMQMDAGLDTGPIVATERVILSGDETAPALEAQLAIAAAELLARSLEPWLAGELTATYQPEEGATLTRPLRRTDGRLDPRLPAAALERQVRAYLPWPGSFAETDRDRLVILRATVGPGDRDDEPGPFVRDPSGLAIATVDGRLVLDEVQPAGGQPMSGEDYLRGRPQIVGRVVRAPATERGSIPAPERESGSSRASIPAGGGGPPSRPA
jgi:methionyl-tRNA formyltransferase